MDQVLLLLVVALTFAAIVFGVTVLVTGGDPGLVTAEPDGRSVPLPGTRPLQESDIAQVRFDTTVRGYRMAQVDQALRRAAYDIGYKDELISVLEAEVAALREGRTADAESLRQAREAALVPAVRAAAAASGGTAQAAGVATLAGAGPARDVEIDLTGERLDEPPVVSDEPPVVSDEAPAVSDEPPAVSDEAPAGPGQQSSKSGAES